LLARARLLREDGQPRRAATLLRRALTRYQNHIDPPAIILRLVQAYLQADMPAAAALWLDRAAKRFGSYRFSYRGRSVSFSQYRQAVLPRHFAAASASPIINPPLRPAYTLDFHDRPYLLEPRFGSLPATRRDLLIIYVRGQLRAYHATSGQPAWPEPLPCRTRPALLGYDDHHAILATAHQIFAVALDRPHIVWQRGHYPPQADDPAVDPETISTWTDHILTSRYLVSFRNRDQAVRIQTDTGQIRWRRRLDHRPAQLAAASPDFVAYIARRHNQTELVLLDATNGQTANTAPLQEVGRIVRLALACDGTVVVVGSRSLLAWDPYNNRRIWQNRLDSPPRLATIQLGVDALYLSNDGCTILKYSLEDGSICWRSARLVPPGQTATFRCRLEGDRLFVLGQTLVAALQIASGRLCWRGTIEPDTALEHFAITRRYVLAVGAQSGGRPDQPSRYVAYLYDRRNDSGLIAPGGLTELGSFASFRSLHVRHRTILAVDARKVRAFTGPTRPGLQHRPQ
ncbi:MAG: PQQ-binding-like beta-propeller repeat protein, partial [Phycisphaerae bacterium]